MYVNAFLFGVIATLAAQFLLAVIGAALGRLFGSNDNDELTEDEYRDMLEEMTGKKFRVFRKNGFMIGEEVDHDDQEQ